MVTKLNKKPNGQVFTVRDLQASHMGLNSRYNELGVSNFLRFAKSPEGMR
jgi:hypothetical protein